jgi:type 1 fimbria pilin
MSSKRLALPCLTLLVLFAPPVSAGCLSHPAQGAPQAVSFGTVSVPIDAPAGTVLVERRSAPAWTSPEFSCSKHSRTASMGTFTTPSALGEGIYDTNVPGIGIRVLFHNDGVADTPVPEDSYIGWGYKAKLINAHFRVQLIKTGKVSTSAALTAGTLARAGYDQKTQVWADLAGTQIEPERPTCAFTLRGLTFALGRVDARELVAAGSSPWIEQTLVSNGCTAATVIDMSFNAAAHPDDASLFAVTGVNAAQGVGIQLTSVEVNAPAVPGGATVMRLPAYSAAHGYVFRARYRATGKAVTPGPANASIVVNVSYR